MFGRPSRGIALGLLAVVSCADEDPIHAYLVERTEIWCERVFGCCASEELGHKIPIGTYEFDDAPITDRASCVRFYARGNQLDAEAYRRSVDLGRLIFRDDLVAFCLLERREESCADYFAFGLSSCHDIFEARVEVGGECGTDDDCIRWGNCAQGVCQPGLKCYSVSDCSGGEYCDAAQTRQCLLFKSAGQLCNPNVLEECDPARARCVLDTCQPKRGLGEACTPGDGDCVAHLRCLDGTCQARLGDGQPCTPDACSQGFYCNSSSAPPICAQKKPDGSPCRSNDECQLDVCTPTDPSRSAQGTCGDPGPDPTLCDGP